MPHSLNTWLDEEMDSPAQNINPIIYISDVPD